MAKKKSKKQASLKTQLKNLQENKGFRIVQYVCDVILVAYCLFVWILILCYNIPNVSFKVNKYMIYTVIPLCFLVSLININNLFILLGEGVTIIADVFLILLGKYEIGTGIFIPVQILYAVYFILKDKSKIRNIVVGAIRVFLTILIPILTKVVLKSDCNTTAILAMIYFPNLVLNAVHAGLLKKWNLMIALILFTLCDTCIGLKTIISGDNPFIKFLEKFKVDHIFYIPSQLMIAMNTHFEHRMENKAKKK